MVLIMRQRRKEQGVQLPYGPCQSFVVKSFEKKSKLSLNYLANTSVFSSKKLSQCLVTMVLARVALIIPGPGEDLYALNPASGE